MRKRENVEISMLSRFLCAFYVENNNVVFSRASEVRKQKNDFICDKNVIKKLMHMYKNVTKF